MMIMMMIMIMIIIAIIIVIIVITSILLLIIITIVIIEILLIIINIFPCYVDSWTHGLISHACLTRSITIRQPDFTPFLSATQ